MILDAGFKLTLRPMQYPTFYEMYRAGIKNTWSVEEVDFSTDLVDLRDKLSAPEKHLIQRLVAFFATGDSIVSNNLVLNLYRHINSPEARLYLSRQLYEEAVHVQFYLTLLDNYVPDTTEREKAFDAVENIPSIKRKAQFCFKWINSIYSLNEIKTEEQRSEFLMNLISFSAAVEGLFFFAAFAYVYFLRSKGLLNGLAAGTNWVFRDESMHMAFGFQVVETVRKEYPHLFNAELEKKIHAMLEEAIQCEEHFAADLLEEGVAGLSLGSMRQYLEFVADQRLVNLGYAPKYKTKNPFAFALHQRFQRRLRQLALRRLCFQALNRRKKLRTRDQPESVRDFREIPRPPLLLVAFLDLLEHLADRRAVASGRPRNFTRRNRFFGGEQQRLNRARKFHRIDRRLRVFAVVVRNRCCAVDAVLGALVCGIVRRFGRRSLCFGGCYFIRRRFGLRRSSFYRAVSLHDRFGSLVLRCALRFFRLFRRGRVRICLFFAHVKNGLAGVAGSILNPYVSAGNVNCFSGICLCDCTLPEFARPVRPARCAQSLHLPGQIRRPERS